MTKLSFETLDKSRAHGYVAGDAEHNIAFTQRAIGIEGWPYDVNGNLIEAALNEQQANALAERRARAAQNANPDPAHTESGDGSQAGNGEHEGSGDGDDSEVNLIAWVTGNADYPPYKVRKAAKARYHINKSLDQIALHMVEVAKDVTRDQVDPRILPPPVAG